MKTPAIALMTATLLSAATAYGTTAARAGDIQGDAYGCDELWSMRNDIFKGAGYCFKSPRAIKLYGNAGCQYDSEFDVPLSDRDRQTISDIKKSEKRQGCAP